MPNYGFQILYLLFIENNPLYFGEMNYFKDGLGGFKNTALLAVGDSLAVFKDIAKAAGWYTATLLYIPSVCLGAFVFFLPVWLCHRKKDAKKQPSHSQNEEKAPTRVS